MGKSSEDIVVMACTRQDVAPLFKRAAKEGVVSVTKGYRSPTLWVGCFHRGVGSFTAVGCAMVINVGVNQWRMAAAYVDPGYRTMGLWRRMFDLRIELVMKACQGRSDVSVFVDSFVRTAIKDAYLRRGFLAIQEFQGSTHVRKRLS